MTVQFTVAGLPITQGSKTVYRGRAVESRAKQLGPWRDAVAAAARAALDGAGQLTGPAWVICEFTFPRPVSHPKRTRTWPVARNDIDKLARAVLDSLTRAGVWADDGQAVALMSVKDYGPEPGVRIAVGPVTP